MRATTRWLSALGFSLLLGAVGHTQPRVVGIEVQGKLHRVAESLILSTIGLKPGIELSQENVQEAMHSLLALNVFEDVQIWGEEVEGGIKVIIVVDEYPALEGMRFKGNKHLKAKDMKEALGLVPGQVVSRKDMARGQQKILELYREKGYLRAQVEGKLFAAGSEDKVFLQYDIKEAEKVKVRGIKILGNKAFSDGKIISKMGTKKKRWFRKGDFKQEKFEEDKEKILAFYHSQGYQQAAIVRDSVYYDDTRKNLYIDIEVDEGQQYRLGKVAWEGNQLFSDKELRKQVKLKKGEIYNLSSQELAWMIRSAYFEKGYLDTEVIPEERIRDDTHSIDVYFQIYEGSPVRVRRITIAGNTKTRDKVLRRELELRPGDIYQQSLIQESTRRLFVLNFFKNVQPEPKFVEVEGKRLVDLTFNVEEKPTGQASMGAGFSDRDRLVGTLGLRIPNLRGLGQNLDFNWEFGSRREQFLVGFTEPWLFDSPTSLSVRVFTRRTSFFNDFEQRSNSVSIRVGRRLKKPAHSSISAGYRLQSNNFSDFNNNYTASTINSGSFSDRTTSSFDLTFTRDTRNRSDFPSRGTFFSYRPEIANSFTGGDINFHSHEVRYNYYRPSLWKFVISVESKMAIIDGFSASDDRNISFFDRFTPGGIDLFDGQVRGYNDSSLGPRIDGLRIGGRSMFVLNLEYRFPIVEQQVYGLFLADAGNAWNTVGGLNPFDVKRSLGFGFRVITPVLGMIGFDFAWGFDRRSVDDQPPGLKTHFQFGPRFF